nr:DUF2142 domain-containing protein [Anaerolineae bacterium]
MPENRLLAGAVLLALLVYGIIGVLYAVNTPPWQAPDEPAHYNYIAQVAGEGCCPLLEPGDWDSAYLEELKAGQFPEDADLTPVQYEDHQPPLYYLVGALVYRLSNGSMLALRILSVIFGAGVALAAYMAVVRLAPENKPIALAVLLFVAFLPQHVAIMASVNNDSLAELVIGMLAVVAIGYVGNPVVNTASGSREALDKVSRPHAVALGGLAGLAFLTKLTIYLPAVLIVATAILCRWRIERHSVRWLLAQVGWAAGLALLLGLPWWIRNIVVYGWLDFLGQGVHNAVVVGQLRTGEYIQTIGFGTYLKQFLTTTYHSFWGQFGWMGVPMPPRYYLVIGIFLIGAVPGVVLFLLLGKISRSSNQKAGIWILSALAAATAFNYLYYNLTFVQLQGRYLFTALTPVGLLVTTGLYGWVKLIGRRLKGSLWRRIQAWLPALGLSWMPILALVALYRFVIPYLE